MYTYPRLWTASLLTILILCVATLTLAHSPTPPGQTPLETASLTDDRPLPVEPDLLKTALQTPETPLDFIIYLTEQADLSKWLPPAQSPISNL